MGNPKWSEQTFSILLESFLWNQPLGPNLLLGGGPQNPWPQLTEARLSLSRTALYLLSLSTGAARISEPWRGLTYKNFSKAASPTLTSGSINKNSGSFRLYSNVSHERLFDVPQISFETTRNWDSHRTQWQICLISLAISFFCQWLATSLALSRNPPCGKNATSTARVEGHLQSETSEAASEIPAMKIPRVSKSVFFHKKSQGLFRRPPGYLGFDPRKRPRAEVNTFATRPASLRYDLDLAKAPGWKPRFSHKNQFCRIKTYVFHGIGRQW